MNFGAARELTRRVAVTGGVKVLILDLSGVTLIDTSASLAIEDMMKSAQATGLVALLVGLHPNVRETLNRVGVTDAIPPEHDLDSRSSALAFADDMLS